MAIAFEKAYVLGMANILWYYLINDAFKAEKVGYYTTADITGQVNHIGATIQADFIKKSLLRSMVAFRLLALAKTSQNIRSACYHIPSIDLCHYQVANCYMGKAGLVNSGGALQGTSDLAGVVRGR